MKPYNPESFPPMILKKEELFIIHCLRSEFGGGINNKFADINLSTIDWNTVFERSIQWGVAPLLYAIMKKRFDLSKVEVIAGQFLQNIRVEFIRTLVTNERNFTELREIAKAFCAVGIKTLLLKGSHLAQYIYQNIGLRPMIDIDILVKKEDLHKAGQLLVRMGYVYPELSQGVYDSFKVSKDARGQAGLLEYYKTDHHHLHPFRNSKGINNLDIHWTLVPPSLPLDIDTEGLWNRAQSKKYNDTDVLILSPEDILLHLSLHTSYRDKFKIYALRSLCDITAAINYYDNRIDWEELNVRARKWKVDKFLYLTLRLSQELLGTRVPNKILYNLKPDPFNNNIITEAKKRIFSLKVKKTGSAIIYHPEKFRQNITLFKKICYIIQRIFISPNELAKNYSLPASCKRIYFYYFIRLVSLPYRYSLLYAKFFLYLFLHKQASPFNYNLNTFLNEDKIG